MAGPCTPYLTPDEVTYCDMDDVTAAALIDLASQVVYALLGRQFPGVCTSTVRPCRTSDCWDPWCDCWCDPDAVELPHNLIAVTQVRIGGAVLASSNYKIIDGHKLIRTDGLRWPWTNNLSAPTSDEHVFEITYTHGRAADAVVKAATSEYVVELYKELTADQTRKLPSSTTGVSRQGVSMTVQDRVEQVRKAGPVFQSMMVAMAVHNPSDVRVPSAVLNGETGWVLHTV